MTSSDTNSPSSSSQKKPPRRAPGNTNALKHGFYSRRFKRSELNDLEDIPFASMEDEIDMLRVCMRRLVEWGHDVKSLPEAISFLRVIASASTSLSRMLRTQQVLGAKSDGQRALDQVLDEIAREKGWD